MMLTIPESFTHDTATLALCWRILRRDGVVMGFTNHDRDLTFGGITHHAASGFDVASAQRLLGLAQSDMSMIGALVSDGLTQEDLLAGRYDQAGIETWLVDWSAPEAHVLIDCGSIGQIDIYDHGFKADIRSILDQLTQPQGRLFQAHCAADLGDGRCTVALDDPAFTVTTSVNSTDGVSRFTTAAGAYAPDWFSRGVVQFASGQNIGARMEIKSHEVTGTTATITLWQAMARLIQSGDRVVLKAGCDKSPAQCQSRFNNIVNFRGFPLMPGNDLLIRRVSDGEAGMDGGSLFQ
jgi:uncharacterized phage protein (TIGR02218 family)